MNNLLRKLLDDRLAQDFFTRETTKVAHDLLGKLLVSYHNKILLVGKIVETEAYRSDDPASHTYRGKTERNSTMFGPIGHAYVYINYGIHYGFNVVARDENFPAGGVLIRAVEPLEGIEVMKKNRHSASDASLKNLTNGPGKLTQAFGITKVDDHLDLLTSSKIFLAKNSIYPHENYTIEKSSRIGISKAREYLWRFYIKKLS